jgi:hypothetical protein
MPAAGGLEHMKNTSKSFIFFVSLMVLSASTIIAHESAGIQRLRDQYKAWQEILDKQTIAKGKRAFHVYSGENYRTDKWVSEVRGKSGDYFIGEEVNLINHDKLGVMFYMSETSPSGDWNIAAEHYFQPSGRLFCVVWKLNTFQALEPLTIEKCLFFDEDGKLLQDLEHAFKLSTRDKVDSPNYMSRSVTYWKSIRDVPFYSIFFR